LYLVKSQTCELRLALAEPPHLIIPLLPHHASTTSDCTAISCLHFEPPTSGLKTQEPNQELSQASKTGNTTHPTQPRFQRLDTAHPIVVECIANMQVAAALAKRGATCMRCTNSPCQVPISNMHVDWCRAHHAARLKLNRRLI